MRLDGTIAIVTRGASKSMAAAASDGYRQRPEAMGVRAETSRRVT
jgi:hypothetical protein